MKKNLINGQRPEIGNPDHIAWVKKNSAMLEGRQPVGEADWSFVRISDHTGEGSRPITYYCDPKEADGMQCYVVCPRCERQHKHVVGYDPEAADQTAELDRVDRQEITCWNCGLEMFVEDDGSRNIYVKVHSAVCHNCGSAHPNCSLLNDVTLTFCKVCNP